MLRWCLCSCRGCTLQAIGDIVVGSVLGNSSQRANEARIASLCAGIPEEVPVRTVNRQCSSGLQVSKQINRPCALESPPALSALRAAL